MSWEYQDIFVDLPIRSFEYYREDEEDVLQVRKRNLYAPGHADTILPVRAKVIPPTRAAISRLFPVSNGTYNIRYLAGRASWAGAGTAPANQFNPDTTKTHPSGEPLPNGVYWYFACGGEAWDWAAAVKLPGSTLSGFGSFREAEDYGREQPPVPVEITHGALMILYADDIYGDNRGTVTWQFEQLAA